MFGLNKSVIVVSFFFVVVVVLVVDEILVDDKVVIVRVVIVIVLNIVKVDVEIFDGKQKSAEISFIDVKANLETFKNAVVPKEFVA